MNNHANKAKKSISKAKKLRLGVFLLYLGAYSFIVYNLLTVFTDYLNNRLADSLLLPVQSIIKTGGFILILGLVLFILFVEANLLIGIYRAIEAEKINEITADFIELDEKNQTAYQNYYNQLIKEEGKYKVVSNIAVYYVNIADALIHMNNINQATEIINVLKEDAKIHTTKYKPLLDYLIEIKQEKRNEYQAQKTNNE